MKLYYINRSSQTETVHLMTKDVMLKILLFIRHHYLVFYDLYNYN